MKARNRFLLIFIIFAIILIHLVLNRFYFRFFKRKEFQRNDFYSNSDFKRISIQNSKPIVSRECRMNSCFDFSKCKHIDNNGLRVHLYPNANFGINSSFGKIQEIIRNSVYFEPNPQKACLFMATIWDPLDRDPLSHDFQRFNPLMTSFEPLFNGVNHVVFNLYSGSWPTYSELDFSYNQNYGKIKEILKKAILIKASQSRDSYRKDFDVSFPLFSKNHPKRGPPFISQPNLTASEAKTEVVFRSRSSPRSRRLLVFKGKRYIYGIGSETRNALHYLNNGLDVLIVTTCKHGKKWKDWKDDKCEKDNNEYDKHDYLQLMANSTFCLVPRGRRLGSYRFLEALQLGCIPVILSNGWVLPFEELIDWKSCVVSADERLLLQIPETLRSFSEHKISQMRQKCLRLYEQFFSSVERIVFTSLLIIENRIQRHVSLDSQPIRGSPSLPTLMQLELMPSLSSRSQQLTAIVFVDKSQHLSDLQKLVQRLESMEVIKETVILWSLPMSPSLSLSSSAKIVKTSEKSRFSLESHLISTEAVLQLSPQTLLTEEEIGFGFSVWNSFVSRIIGFVGRTHYFRETSFEYSSKWTNHYSLVEMDSSIYHKRFHDLFLASKNSTSENCWDLFFLFLVSHITREGPLKVTQRKRSSLLDDNFMEWNQRRECFQTLLKSMTYLPLITSQLRFDPLLFKDNVSVKRKKFRKLEK